MDVKANDTQVIVSQPRSSYVAHTVILLDVNADQSRLKFRIFYLFISIVNQLLDLTARRPCNLQGVLMLRHFCPSVRPSVCLFVSLVHCVEQAKCGIKLIKPRLATAAAALRNDVVRFSVRLSVAKTRTQKNTKLDFLKAN